MTPAATPPRDPDVPDELPEQALTALEPDQKLEELALGDADLSGVHAPGVAFRRVRMRGTQLSGAELDGLELFDVELRGCDLANLRGGAHAGLIRVRARTCRMTGLTLSDGVLRDVAFHDCRINLASFGGCRLQRVRFEGCDLTETDFLEAELDSVVFHGCELVGTDLRGARLRHCELRENRLEAVHGIDRLRGVAMPWVDIVGAAGLWAHALGIEVLDADGADDSGH